MEIPNHLTKVLEKAIVGFSTINFDDGKPHNIAVEINKVENQKIIITDNHFNKTFQNLQKNPQVSLVFWNEEVGFRIDGIVEYQIKGKWFDFVKKLDTNKGYSPRGAVIVNVTEITALL